MNPIEELKVEHRAIETALDILSRISRDTEQRPATEVIRDAGRLIDFFKTFSDACHHGKEEEHLFPILEQMGVSRDGGPIGVMLIEHDMGLVMNISDMVTVLNYGQKIAEGTPREVQNNEDVISAYLGEELDAGC